MSKQRFPSMLETKVIPGWVIVYSDGFPINYYADHGYLDPDYLVVDRLFKSLCKSLWHKISLEEIITVCNTTMDDLHGGKHDGRKSHPL